MLPLPGGPLHPRRWLPAAALCLLALACVQRVDPASRYVGTYDCQVTMTETNLPGSKMSQAIGTVVVENRDRDSVSIRQEGLVNLTFTGEITAANKLFVRKQDVEVVTPQSGVTRTMTLTGNGTAVNDKLSLSYTATTGVGKYTFTTQLTGLRRGE